MAEQPPQTPGNEPEAHDVPPEGGESPTDAPSQATAAATTAGPDSILSDEVELKDERQEGDTKPLDLNFVLDIPLTVTVEVGRTRLLIQELLQLGQGSVIELDKLMGEPFEVMVNDKLVARGEIVVVNDRFGVRLTDIISPTERVQSLG